MTDSVDIHLDSPKVYKPDPEFHNICEMLANVRHVMDPLSPLEMAMVCSDFARRAKVDPSLLSKGNRDKRRPLTVNVVRRFPYELISSNGSINQFSESLRVARDGRALAISCEFAAAKLFGLQIAGNSNQQDFDAYGLREQKGKPVLTRHSIRTLTTHGVKCVKSSKVGGGRTSTDDDVIAYANSVDSMIFIDVTSTHTYSILEIPSTDFLNMLVRTGGEEIESEFGVMMKKIKYAKFWEVVLKSFYLEFVEVDLVSLFFDDVAASVGSQGMTPEQANYLLNQNLYELGHRMRIVAEVQSRMQNNPYFIGDVRRMESAQRSLTLKNMIANDVKKQGVQKKSCATKPVVKGSFKPVKRLKKPGLRGVTRHH